jgi:mono/diheme cytochrome c family protein
VSEALWNGVLGTSMPAWRDRSVEDLAAIAAFVRELASDSLGSAMAEQLALGERVYRESCIECHGAAGGGDGFAAKELAIKPTNFRGRRATLAETLKVLAEGVDGTSMAPWSERLTADELASVAHYVRSLYVAETP